MAERVTVRDISHDEGQRLLRMVRRSAGSVVTWRRAQMVLLSVQGMDVAGIAKGRGADPRGPVEPGGPYAADGRSAAPGSASQLLGSDTGPAETVKLWPAEPCGRGLAAPFGGQRFSATGRSLRASYSGIWVDRQNGWPAGSSRTRQRSGAGCSCARVAPRRIASASAWSRSSTARSRCICLGR